MQAFMTKLAMAAMLLGGAVGAQAAACPMNYATSPAQDAVPKNGGYGQFHVSACPRAACGAWRRCTDGW